MAHNLPPTRFSADPETSHALRALVDHARADLPDVATLSRFSARLDATIAANVPPPEVNLPPPATAVAVAGGGKILGIALSLLVGGSIAGGTFLALRNPNDTASSSSSGAPMVSQPAPNPTVIVASSPPTEPPQLAPSANLATLEVPNASKRVQGRDPISEAALLDSARAALSSNPRRALNLTREHARRFPKGNLVQEREVIAIEALRRLGKSDAARERGSNFEQRYPDSAHQSKVEQTLKGD